MESQSKMFCYQCQETACGTGCTLKGVCGKHADTSGRMDLLLYGVSGFFRWVEEMSEYMVIFAK